jgi:hypothetical protein
MTDWTLLGAVVKTQIHVDRMVTDSAGVQLRRDGQVVELDGVAVAKPCVPFTKWMLRDQDADDAIVAPNRAFLEGGMRGFVLGLADQHKPVAIRVGDELWAAKS